MPDVDAFLRALEEVGPERSDSYEEQNPNLRRAAIADRTPRAFERAQEQADASHNLRYGRVDQGDKRAAREDAAIDTGPSYPPERSSSVDERNPRLRDAAAGGRRSVPYYPDAEASSSPVEQNPRLRDAAAGGPRSTPAIPDAERSSSYSEQNPSLRRAATADRHSTKPEGDVTAAAIDSGIQPGADVRGERIRVATNSGDGGHDSLTQRYGEEDKGAIRRDSKQDNEAGRRQAASQGVPFTDPANPDIPQAEGPKQPKGKITQPGKTEPKVAKKGGPKAAYANSKGSGEEDLGDVRPGRPKAPQYGGPGTQLPDYGDNPSLDQRNAMNAQELNKQGRDPELVRFLSPKTTQMSVKAGLQDLKRFIGLGDEAIAGASPNPQAAQRLSSGEGAMSPQEVAQLKDTVDPRKQLSEDARLIAGMNASYEFYMRKGEPAKAAAMQRGILLHIKNVVSRGGYIAQAALEARDYQGAANSIAKTYSMIPDGQTMKITSVGKDGKVGFALADDETGKLTHQGEATVNQLMYVATGMQNGSLWFEQMSGIAEKGVQAARRDEAAKRGEAREQRAVDAAERAERRATAQADEAKKKEGFYARRDEATQGWANVSTDINAARQDLADARASGDPEALKTAQDNWQAAVQAGRDFIKSSPEAGKFAQQFNSLTRPTSGGKAGAGAGGSTQRGNGGAPTLEDRMTDPERLNTQIDDTVKKILPTAADPEKGQDQLIRGRRLLGGIMRAPGNEDITPDTAGRFVHHVLAGSQGVELTENSITVPNLGKIAITPGQYLELKDMAARAAATRAKQPPAAPSIKQRVVTGARNNVDPATNERYRSEQATIDKRRYQENPLTTLEPKDQ